MRYKADFSSYTCTEMRKLYEENTSLFAERASEAIKQACIGKTPEQTLKLRQMQWTIDAQLRKGKTPLAKMQIMENIFYRQVYGKNGQLDKLMSNCVKAIYAISGTKVNQNESEVDAHTAT